MKIVIKNARTNNLQNISLEIPHNKFIVVTGVSGSGKSSLAFDIIAREGQRRYFETMPSFARQFTGKMSQPEVDSVDGLSPVIAIGQKTSGNNGRSTVGTMTDIYDLLRLLYARSGASPEGITLSRSLFSFNTEQGKCQQCNGIGSEEKIDINKLIAHPEKTIREGALAPTLPNGYIMYSQVTIDVLNQVCEAEGFDVNIPWNQLKEEQQNVILYGSDKIKVPFGKHSLESRLKWSGIKAKPREEGFYKGIIPIMSDILRRDRNANILKYVSSVQCSACKGKRLNPVALGVKIHGKSIADLSELEIGVLDQWLQNQTWDSVSSPIIGKILEKTMMLANLGLAYLTLDMRAGTLSAGEAQRIRVINQLTAPLSDVLYVLDEPSIGLHPAENAQMIAHLKRLVKKGNTVMVVEHDLETIRNADWIIDIGPKAGAEGGKLLYNGSLRNFLKNEKNQLSPTYRALTSKQSNPKQEEDNFEKVNLIGCTNGNLKNVSASFAIGGLNVVSGKSGSGTKELVLGTLKPLVEAHLNDSNSGFSIVRETENIDHWDSFVFVDQSPIGRTPRSNPATYLGISDLIRDLFASLPDSKKAGYAKSRFSFNNKGGRCETCQGAGKIQIGMHFLGKVDIRCGTCGGDRFNKATLSINYKGKSIANVYRLSVDQALDFFDDSGNKTVKRIRKGLLLLQEIGLGYLKLGQSSTSLSGGEAQRIKIANQLQKRDTGRTLFMLIEPSIGLHYQDLDTLLRMFRRIKSNGNTIVCLEQDENIISASDWHIVLGPEGGKQGGEIIYQGLPQEVWDESSVQVPELQVPDSNGKNPNPIELRGVTTNGLKNVNVSFPKHQLTVVTGLSGSGKSSLVYDTLFAEANARFSESLSIYNRSFVQQNSTAELESFSGLTPAIALKRRSRQSNKRSTVGTLSGIYDKLRLLFARWNHDHTEITAQHFSFNHHLGACETCKGYGVVEQCAPDKIIVNPQESIFSGAFAKNKSLDYYTNLNGQFMATVKIIATEFNWNLELPWSDLSVSQQEILLYGTDDREWNVEWHFKNRSRSGVQKLKTTWLGFCGYINDEFDRKRNNKNTQSLEELLHDVVCPECNGNRLKKHLLEYKILDMSISEWSELSINKIGQFSERLLNLKDERQNAIATSVIPGMLYQLETLNELGLPYLSLNRSVSSLSGGEFQRVLLSGQLASYLHGVTYVMDEPTIGLDEVQVGSLVKMLRKVISNGNTVVVVEHDSEFIRNADYLIEMGPRTGADGGQVVFQGDMSSLADHPNTLTFKLLGNSGSLPEIVAKTGNEFGVKGAHANNLKHVDVSFVKGELTVIAGVSGSGKSSLLRDVVYASSSRNRAIGCDQIFGFEDFSGDKTVFIDQQPLAPGRLTVPASYVELLSCLQILYAKLDVSKEAGLKKSDFSYLSKKGKCPACSGHGKIKTSLDFMSDVWNDCDTCSGLRYTSEIISIEWRGKSIGDVLRMTVDEACQFLESDKKCSQILGLLQSLGLGHIVLGQPGNSLSGGEAQRLKLTKHLISDSVDSRLFLIDEPGTGLHFEDLKSLIFIFQKLIDGGATIVCIDHNHHLIESANSVVRLGPGSGENGGEII